MTNEEERRLAVRYGHRVYGAWLVCASALAPPTVVAIAVGRLRRDVPGGYGYHAGWFDEDEHRATVARLLAEADRLGVTIG